jgi:outer membrane lipoprotein-sorting protein
MPPSIKLWPAASLALLASLTFVPARAALAAEDRESILRRLDAASARFQTTAADFEFDTVQTDPIPDKDTQKGRVYFERKGVNFQMAVHQTEYNSRPVAKIYGRFGGTFKMFDPKLNEVTTSKKFDKYESFLMLGFGASGRELAEKWEIRYLGSEVLDRVRTEKLELVAKDPDVRKLFPVIVAWIDLERGVSLKLHLDEGSGTYRDCFYFNIKVNQLLPADAFVLKTDKQTTIVSR